MVVDSLDHSPGDKLLGCLCFFALLQQASLSIIVSWYECDISVRQILKNKKDKCILLIVFQVNISYILWALKDIVNINKQYFIF